MANPQKEDGHVDIANSVMDALCKIRIPGEARQVLDFIIRKTWGWKKKEDAIPLSQFVEGTGLTKVHVCQAISKLVVMNLITEKGNKTITEKGNVHVKVYGFNKHFDTWKALPKKVTLPKKVKTVTEKGKNSLPKKGTSKDTYSKDNTKDNNPPIIPPDIDPSVWKEFEAMRKKIKKPLTDYAKKLILGDLEKISKATGQDKNEILEQSIKNDWQGVFEIKQGGNNGNGSNRTGSAGQTHGYKSAAANLGDDQPFPDDLAAFEQRLRERGEQAPSGPA